MKFKIVALAFISMLLYSCSTSKTTTKPVAEEKPFVPVVAEAAVLTEDLQKGKTSYENNCARCHKLYDTKQFTAEEWTPIMLRMQKKARIDDAERDLIYAYVTMK